jgi:outer membrane lipoprotein SlyB
VGSAAEEGLTRTQGVEITVREDDGSMRAYVQEVQKTKCSVWVSVCASPPLMAPAAFRTKPE